MASGRRPADTDALTTAERAPEAPRRRPQRRLRDAWRGWPGGVAMIIVCLAPEVLLYLGRPAALRFHVGPNFGFDVGTLLAEAPGTAAFLVLARLVGYRRRDTLLMFFPIPNLYLAWIAGA